VADPGWVQMPHKHAVAHELCNPRHGTALSVHTAFNKPHPAPLNLACVNPGANCHGARQDLSPSSNALKALEALLSHRDCQHMQASTLHQELVSLSVRAPTALCAAGGSPIAPSWTSSCQQ
jgi:hypothetical protein